MLSLKRDHQVFLSELRKKEKRIDVFSDFCPDDLINF